MAQVVTVDVQAKERNNDKVEALRDAEAFIGITEWKRNGIIGFKI